MISFVDKTIDKQNFQVWLYSPGGTFLGELVVDNPRLNLQLEGTVSTFEFEIVENIDRVTALTYNSTLERNESTGLNSEVNPRLNEALDQFQVEVWYGDLDTEDYQKQRFIIINTPNSFGNDITRFSYKAYSREYENKFIRVIDWPGILINEYVDTFTPTSFNSEQSFELSYVPRDSRLVRVDIVKDFIQRLINITPSTRPFEFSFSPNINTIKVFKKSGSGYALLERDRDYFVAIDDLTQLISIIWVLDGGNTTITTNDQIFIDYKFEKLTTLNLTRIASPPRNTQFDFYYTVNNETGVSSVHCYIPEVNKLFSKENVNLYEDPPIYSDVKSEIKVKVYYELNAEDFVEFVEESEDTYTTPTSLENYYEQTLNRYLTKDGLTIQQVLDNLLLNNGDEDNNDAKWKAYYQTSLLTQIRSGFNFNNTTLWASIDQTLKSFDAIILTDTINKSFYVYDKNKSGTFSDDGKIVSAYRQNTGLSIEYGKYLQDVSQSISTEEIVTVIRGLGEDNITAASATPTGYNEWEDYTYYLDGAELLNIVDIVQQKAEPRLNKSSRWMSDSLTIKLLLWLYAREEVEKTLYQEMPLYANGTEPAYRINGVMLSRNPREYFLDNYDIPEYAGVEPEKGFISVLDHIENLKILAAEELIPLKVKSSEFGTMLDILTENSSVTHLATWSKTGYSVGVAGYTQYITDQKEDLDNNIDRIEALIKTMDNDVAWINMFLQGLYQDMQKQNLAVWLGTDSYFAQFNFTAADFKELNGFRREGIYENKFITRPSALFKQMKIEIESLRQPRVEVSTNIIGILQAMDAREDWNSLVLGGLANVVIARLNIDIQIQIKTLVITPDSNQTTFTFSTQKNYIGTGQKFLGRFFADAAYNLKNNLGYNEGQWNYAVETADDASSKLNSGFNVGNANPLKTNTVLIDANGISTNGSTINPQDDSIVNTNDEIGRMLYFHFVKINAGRIEVYTEDNTGERVNEIKIQPNGLFQTSDRAIVSLDQEGFTIRTNVAGVLEKQFYVDTDGNIVFAGRLTQALSNALKGEPGTNGINGINGTNGIHGGSGPKGDDGDEGDVGPGVVYQGQWREINTSIVPHVAQLYEGTSVRADVVLYDNDYYYCIQSHTADEDDNAPPNTSFWRPFGAQFDSVATNILLTANANITKGLVIGDAVTIAQNAFIRSHLATNVGGMAFSGAQQGFILRSDGQFLFGNATNSIKWDNATLDIKGDITAGTIGRLNIKTTGLPSLYTGGSIIFANQFSLRSTNSQATDLWLTDNAIFNNGTLNSTAPYEGMAIGSNSTGITRGVVEVGMKAVTGSNVDALNYVQMTSVGILMKQRDYITTSDNKAYVPAASFNTSTSILTIFLPGS